MQNQDLTRKHTNKKLDVAEKRVHCVSVRLSPIELAELDAHRGKYQRGEALRMAALVSLPTPISKLDKDAWIALGKSANNLNQLTRSLNSKEVIEVFQIREILAEFRTALLTAKG
jgi:hypothetical protein